MQLIARSLGAAWSSAFVVLLFASSPAQADGELTMRGAYYKERSTRVTQPMLDARFDVGEHGELRGHTLVDSITSASVAAGAAGTAFDERRYELGLSYLHDLDRVRVGGGSRLSTEPDYKSAFFNLRGEMDFAQRNTTLALNLAGGRDTISNAGAQTEMFEPIEGTLWTQMGSVSLTQVLSPVVVGQLTYDLIHLRGYQENPYRLVAAGGILESERVPDRRWRHAARAGLRTFVPRTVSTLVGSYRFYIDDWGIVGHTPEVRWIQQLVEQLDVHLAYRLHHQSAADFFEPIYDSADPDIEPYLTDDAKLDRMTTQTFGIKLDATLARLGIRGPLAQGRVSALFEYITQTTYFGNAVSAQAALSLPFSY